MKTLIFVVLVFFIIVVVGIFVLATTYDDDL